MAKNKGELCTANSELTGDPIPALSETTGEELTVQRAPKNLIVVAGILSKNRVEVVMTKNDKCGGENKMRNGYESDPGQTEQNPRHNGSESAGKRGDMKETEEDHRGQYNKCGPTSVWRAEKELGQECPGGYKSKKRENRSSFVRYRTLESGMHAGRAR